jgi:nucleoside 2-deoxyribosyltransferase
MMSDVLQSSICYLAGAIDFAKDLGVGWRDEIKAKTKGMGIRYLDPCKKMENLAKDVGEEQRAIDRLKAEGKFEELREMMKKIVRSDLRMIDYSDFMICYIDPQVHSAGTYHELVLSLSQKKPTLIVIKGGIVKSPSWIFGISKIDYMFDSIDDVCSYLNRINSGEQEPEKEWVLIRKQLKDYEEN